MSEENREIFEWLEPEGCWHEWHKVQYHGIRERMACSKCGDYQRASTDNPNYLDPATAVQLVEDVRVKGPTVDVQAMSGAVRYQVTIWPGRGQEYIGQADSLPEAIRSAVIKLVREQKV
jgi:hypothetical protein